MKHLLSKLVQNIWAWLFFPIFVGIAAGILTSKILWNYAFSPAEVQIEPNADPITLSFVMLRPDIVLGTRSERDESLVTNDTRCREFGLDECIAGELLNRTGIFTWFKKPMLDLSEIEKIMHEAQLLSPVSFFQPGSRGFEFIATYETRKGRQILVLFNSVEIRDDTHGHLELLMEIRDGRLSAIDSAYNYYDVAGIEFATPRFLAIFGAALALLITYLSFVVKYVIRYFKQH